MHEIRLENSKNQSFSSSWLTDEKRADVLTSDAFKPWLLREKGIEEFYSLSTEHQLTYLSWFGLLAPTTHNTVPEKFALRPDENSIVLHVDRGTTEHPLVLGASDKEGRQATVSMGCVSSNIEMAASCYGLTTHIELLTDKTEEIRPPQRGDNQTMIPLARLSFGQSERPPLDPKFLTAMLNRKVVRAEFLTEKPDAEVSQKLQQLAHEYPSLQLHLESNIPLLAQFQEQGMAYVLKQHDFARELGEWFLPNNDLTSSRGMRGHEFGKNLETSTRFHLGLQGLLPPGENLRADEFESFSKGEKYITNNSSAFGIITAEKDDVMGRFNAGRLLEKAAITLLAEHNTNISIQAASVEVQMANFGLRGYLRALNRRPVALFRMGKPRNTEDLERPHSSRPSIEEVILFNERA